MNATESQVEQNILAVKCGYEAFARRDPAALHALMHESVEWHGGGGPNGVGSAHYIGRDAVLEYLGNLVAETQGTMQTEATAYAGTGDLVFVRDRTTSQRAGRHSEIEEVLVFTVVGGQVRRIDVFLQNFDQYQAFWS